MGAVERGGLAQGGQVAQATDLNRGGAALLITLLAERGQQLLYILGRTAHRTSEGYRDVAGADAKDAAVIADQARMRRDLHLACPRDDASDELHALVAL